MASWIFNEYFCNDDAADLLDDDEADGNASSPASAYDNDSPLKSAVSEVVHSLPCSAMATVRLQKCITPADPDHPTWSIRKVGCAITVFRLVLTFSLAPLRSVPAAARHC